MMMRKALKVLHTLAAAGLIGGLAAYALVLWKTPQASAASYADMRITIEAIANWMLLPSLAVALVSGLLSMAAHRPFQEQRWAWAKALTGIGMFEATLAVIQAKANTAAKLSAKVAAGEAGVPELATAIHNEWYALALILIISVANVVIGVWRPRFEWPARKAAVSAPAADGG